MRSKSYEQLESQIRLEFQAAYKQKIKTMYSMFELKYQSLEDSIISVYDRIKKDQLLATMINDKTSSIHMEDRVKEIFREVIEEERELIFIKMGTQITNLKFENEELSRTIKRLKESTTCMEKQFNTQRLNIEQAKNSVHDQLKKIKEENIILKNDKNNYAKELQELRVKVEQIGEENYQLKTLLNNLKQNRDALIAQTKQIELYRSQIKSLQGEVQNLKGILVENQEKFDRKYQNKKKEFKQKIEQYKNVINQMRNERIKTEMSLKQMEDEQLQADSQKKMLILIKEHEKKLNEVKISKEKEKSEIERKYEYKLKQCQNYFNRMMEAKVIEVQQNVTEHYQKIKQQGLTLEKQLQFYKQNFISLEEHDQEITKREELMMIMKKKLEQYESVTESLAKNQEKLNFKLKETETVLFEFKNKVKELTMFNKDLSEKHRNYQQANNILKINQKKIKDQFDQYERLIKKNRDQNEDLKRNVILMEENRNQYELSLREKERKFKQLAEEHQILSKKLKKSQQSLDYLSREKESLQSQSKQLKKSLTNLQYKLKDHQLTSNLNQTSLDSRLSTLQQDLKEKNVCLNDLQKKYQELSVKYQEEKTKNYQIQNQMKKYQMENKFYKENLEIQKKEQSNYLQEMRKNINEKNKKIEDLTSEIDNKVKVIRNCELEKDHENDRLLIQNNKLKTKLKTLKKCVQQKLQSIRKEGYLIKDYLVSRQTILNNDSAIILSSFQKELSYVNLFIEQQINVVSKKVKEELNLEFEASAKLIKKEYQENLKKIFQKHEQKISILKQQTKQKENKMEEVNRQVKSSQLEVKKIREESKIIEKQYQMALTRNQQLKEHHQSKLKNLVKEMKEEREVILKEYNDKKSQMEEQICQLMSSLKQLKNQILLIQARHEQEKITINAQLRTVKEQEEVIQKIAQQKQNQILKYQKNNEQLEETKKGLENQIRSYVDAINRKIELIHQLELKDNQFSGENSLIKNKCERMTEEIGELKRKLSQREEELEQSEKSKARIENELRDIKGALNRSTKNNQIRALNAMSMETLQLSQKVNEMRKCSALLDAKTPLRS